MTIALLLVAVLLVVLIGLVWKLSQSVQPDVLQQQMNQQTDEKLKVLKEEWSERLSGELERVWKQVQMQVQTTDKSVGEKLEQTNRTFADLKQQLGSLKEETEQVRAVGKDISSLQDLLRAPKLRGELGEFFLSDLLAQILPSDYYSFQYGFASGERVDAVIQLKEGIVPVDSKFPLEQFNKMRVAESPEEAEAARKQLVRDVKKHIDVIAQKYICPEEGTFDFALMYIPAENVYYEVVVKAEAVGDEKGVFQHAIGKRVIPVSPNSFYAYLQVILWGLRGMQVESKAKQILADLIKLQQELGSVRDDFNLTRKHMNHAVGSFDKADRRLEKFEDHLDNIEAKSSTEVLEEVTHASES